MAFMNFDAFFYARNDLKLFKIAKQIKILFYKNYTLNNFKDELNPNNENFFIKA